MGRILRTRQYTHQYVYTTSFTTVTPKIHYVALTIFLTEYHGAGSLCNKINSISGYIVPHW